MIELIGNKWAKLPKISKKIRPGNEGFYNLIDTKDIEAFAKKNRNKYKYFVVLGIGGSALGTICLQESLGHLFKKNLFVLDNIDPVLIKELEDIIDYKKTLFVVISKSGTTTETLAQYNYFKKKTKNFVFIGNFPKPTFKIPENIGGRFSVLTAVGLLPAALLNFDIKKILQGVKKTKANLTPAYQLAALQHKFYKQGKNIVVLMPYAQKLFRFADWYRQLLAESIGKNSRTGITPVNALGATDQHSQLQLYSDGPNDKFFIFIEVESLKPNIPPFNKLLNIELNATREALTRSHRPCVTIKIPTINEDTLGALFMFFEAEIAFLGEMFKINAFDQPGVELTKKLIKKALKTA